MFEYLAPSELQHLFIHNNNLNSPERASWFNDGILSVVEVQSKSEKPCKGGILKLLKRNQTNLLNASAIATGTGMVLPASALKQTNTDLPLV